MQMAAMPPYGGLDEFFHVARLAFVFEEHRNPTTAEPSIPKSLAISPGWPQRRVVIDHAVSGPPYVGANYEAQQPSVYYTVVAPLAALAPRTVMSEMRVWRLASFIFAIVTVIAIASIGERWFGPTGIVAAASIVFVPTWETLVMRASNDAFACAVVAVAIAGTVRQKTALEMIAWPLAIAIKLYTWPIAIVAPFLWWRQRAPKTRVAAVTAASLIAAVLTLAALSARTNNPIGVTAFDRPASQVPRLNIGQIVTVTIASAAWTSGEHFDAMKPLAIAAYVLPLLVAVALSIRRNEAWIAATALVAFGAAQAVNVIVCVVTKSPQIGGKEGWYWFALAPVLVPALLAPAVARFRWVPWWIVAWDIVITDFELIPTWLGLTSPSHPSLLFRWGPMQLPPWWIVPFRAAQLAMLFVMVRRA